MAVWAIPKIGTACWKFLGPVWDSPGLIRTDNGPCVLNLCVVAR